MSKEYKEKRKKFLAELDRIHQEHKPAKWEARKRYPWKKEWGPFIKYQADWDGSYFLDLIIYKLERMYAELSIFSNEVPEDLKKRLKVLENTIALGKKTQTYEYDTEYREYSNKHCSHVVLIYDNEGKTGIEALRGQKLLAKVPQERPNFEDEDFNFNVDDILGNRAANKWVEEHGYTKDQVHYAYSGEWDSEENYKQYLKLVKKSLKEEQNDLDKFFKMISRNFRSWWW